MDSPDSKTGFKFGNIKGMLDAVNSIQKDMKDLKDAVDQKEKELAAAIKDFTARLKEVELNSKTTKP
ncbi:MAG: hypothetical protein NTZ16_16370 [Verrucomicrobia bacterium]|nr:hypothetical protein [Verrucomicrobiota bacterium]